MSSDDWYRNVEWNDDIEDLFNKKLKRSRSQREQYMVIQALSLVNTFPLITLQIVNEYFETRKDKYEDVRAYLAQAEAYISLNQMKDAINSYRLLLKREEEFPNHRTTSCVDYPYIVATQALEDEYENALYVLYKNEKNCLFPLDKFKWHASVAIIESDSSHANIALEAAKIKRSGFRFHQDVGVVGEEHKQVIKYLCKLSS